MLIYLDRCILMYFFDHTGDLNLRASNRLAALAAAGDSIGYSDLVRLECRVKPLSRNDAMKLAAFDAFFARPEVQLAPLTTAVFDRATAIRARHRFKLGDSLHLAAAVESRCDRFLTNDGRLAACADIPIRYCPEIGRLRAGSSRQAANRTCRAFGNRSCGVK